MNKENLLNLISDTEEKAFEQFVGANEFGFIEHLIYFLPYSDVNS